MGNNKTITKVCMLAGKIMLQSGAETYRVEDTMIRIAAHYGLPDAQSYATPTVINFATGSDDASFFVRIEKRTNDLHKITEVNYISRKITAGKIAINEALEMLQELENKRLFFSWGLQIITAALVSGCFTIMFGGMWPDFLPALITGGAGFAGMVLLDRLVEIRFISEFFASFIIGIFAIIFVNSGFGVEMDKIIIGAVMPLVPGLHITNAVRDLLAGHLVSGVSKGMEALLTAFAIGAGIAVVFAIV